MFFFLQVFHLLSICLWFSVKLQDVYMCICPSQVRLYMDCEEYHRVDFIRSPQPLTFEASSGIFVGNAGGTGMARFVVSLDGTIFTKWSSPAWSAFEDFSTTSSSVFQSSSLYGSCISAKTAPHYCHLIWINELNMDVKSTARCRNKRGVWAIAYYTFETWTQ